MVCSERLRWETFCNNARKNECTNQSKSKKKSYICQAFDDKWVNQGLLKNSSSPNKSDVVIARYKLTNTYQILMPGNCK
jgi:hypothetical protein